MPGHFTQELDKTVLHNLITRGDINIAGVDTVEYEGRDIPLELIYGALPEGANYWVAEDLNGDGFLEVFAASTSEGGEETIYNVYDINSKGNVVSTDYQDYQANIQAAASGYGVEITCLVDGCSISIIPDYGFWMTIRDAFKSITTFPESSDEQELAEAQMFQFFTRKLQEASNGDIDKATFLSDLENSGYPFNDAFMRRFEKQFENAQYNGFLNRIGALFEEGDGQAIQDFFDRYENSGIADNSFVIENSFSLMNPSDIINRAILGDGDIGVTIDVCTTPGQTNCVDPKAINDIWEDFGRHIRVIFKGLEIPGLPEWLPLPGIMKLPTIGEIWDKVTGPFTDAAREQLKDCMSKDDDGDGVNNTASYCMENRDIIGIITKGLEDGAGEIIDATTEAVGGIVDKALEGIDCVLNPIDCARKIKDVLGGVLGGADPTQPGLPPWMRAIIIGSQYGDKVLKELEKIFNSDIDGDGTIGILPTQEYCADGVTVKEDAEGTNCPEYAEFGYCTDGTTKKQDSAGTNCPDYVPDYGMCDDGLTKKEDAEGTNCPGPEPVVNEGDPCNLENEGTGTYQYVGDELQCIPDPPEFGFCQDGVTEKEDAEGTNCDEYEGPDDGTYDPVCTEPRPTGTLTFALQEQQFAWDQNCQETHCTDGSLIPESGVCAGENGNDGDDKCENGADPQYIVFDEDKDGAFTDPRTGKSYTYDPCDSTQPPVEVNPQFGTNQGDACDLAEAGYSSGGVGVIDANGDCKQVGQKCNRQSYGFGSEDNCPTGQGYNTSSGIIDSNGDCVCPAIEEPPEVDCSEITEDNYQDCNKVKCPEGSTTPYADSLDDCVAAPAPTCEENDPNSESDGQGGCQCKQDYALDNDQNSPTFGTCQPTKLPPVVTCEDPNATNYEQEGECGPCNSGFDRPAKYDVCTSIEQLCADGAEGYGTDNELCGTSNGCPEGQKKFDGENCEQPCADNPDIGASDLLCGVVPATCNDPNAVNDGEDGPCRCKPGFVKGDDGLCFQSGDVCENGATVESGCDTCPDGTGVIEYEDGICPAQNCSNPAYAAANPDECLSAPPPETGSSSSSSSSGGFSMFDPFIAGISYTKQAVPEPPAPAQKDYVVELDNLIKRSLFEGMA